MVSNLVFYQLALIALLWVFLMLSWVWPSEPAAARPMPPTSVPPPRKRSTAPKPFAGLTQHVFFGYAAIFQKQLAGRRRSDPKLVFLFPDRESRKIFFNQKCRDALVAL